MTGAPRWLFRWESFLLFILIVVMFGATQLSPYFLTASNFSIALAGAMPVAIIALPMTLVIITGEIDISVGSMVGLCATSMAVCLELHIPVGFAMGVGILVGMAAGLFNGVIIVGFGLPSLVVTVGTLALFRGIAQILLKQRGVSNFPDWYQQIGFGNIPNTPIPWSVVIFLIFFALFGFFLHFTYRGRSVYAIGNNREAARASGINVERTMIGIFVASGTISAISSIILTSYLASARSDIGSGMELTVITAVVLGGVNIFGGSGTIVGVLLSLLVLAFVKNTLGLLGMTPEQQDIVTGSVLVGTLIAFGGIRNLDGLRAFFARNAIRSG